jgi:hypothetical protein
VVAAQLDDAVQRPERSSGRWLAESDGLIGDPAGVSCLTSLRRRSYHRRFYLARRWRTVKRLRFPGGRDLLVALAIGAAFALTGSPSAARADTRANGIGFDAPVFVAENIGGGEPSVIYDPRAHDYIYTAHEGTSLTDHDNIADSGDSDANWLLNYRNQVNVWISPDGFDWTKVSWNGTGFTNDPLTNTGFSDPDLTMDAGGRVYDTGIDLANDALFSSTDGGRTWPTGTINCHDGDRPWLAGGRANEVFMATDTVENALSHEIYRSTNGGASCGSTGFSDAGTIPKSSPLDPGDSYTGYGKLRYGTHGLLKGALIEPIVVTGANNNDGIGVSVLMNADKAFNTGRWKICAACRRHDQGVPHPDAVDLAGYRR